MIVALFFFVFIGPILAICLLLAFWKHLLVVALLAIGLMLAGRILERRDQRRRTPPKP